MSNPSPRIVFMGTPDFAVATLDALVSVGCNVVGVITAPDKPAGRGKKLQSSAVKKYAELKGLPILQPTNLKSPEFQASLKEWNPELQVVVAFRMLPESVWSLPELGTINLHASLLPQYRGAAPINRAIMNGETESGVTTFFIRQQIDTGAILLQEKVGIGPEENAGSLHDRLMTVGANLVTKTVALIAEGNYEAREQASFEIAEDELKEAPKIFKEDCRINWNQSLESIHNHIRGLSPYPAAWTELETNSGERILWKVFAAEKEVSQHQEPAGKLLTDGKLYIRIAVDGGYLSLKKIQQAGKKALDIEDFLRGVSLENGTFLK